VQVVTPGTSAWLDVRVKNNTMSTMSGADVTLSSKSEFVTSQNTSRLVGNLTAGYYKTLNGAQSAEAGQTPLFYGGTGGTFSFSVQPGCPMGTVLPLTITFNNSGAEWTDTIEVTATAAAPRGLTVTAAGDTALAVSWDAVSGAAAYEVRYNIEDNRGAALSVSAAGTSAMLSGLAANTTYYVWVRAKLGDIAGAFASASGKTLVAAPSALAVSAAGVGELLVTWPAAEGATGYDLLYSAANNAAAAAVIPDAASPHTISGLDNGASYYVWVRPKTGATQGQLSAAVSGTTVLPAPALFSLAAGGPGKITALWSVVLNADGYDLYYSAAGAGDSVKVNSVTSPHTLSALADGTIYAVQVQARRGAVLSTYSEAREAITRPAAPLISVISADAFGALTVTWGAVTGAASYDLYYHTANNSGAATLVNGAASPHTLTGLANGTLYYAWVRARNAGGESALSAAASGVTLTLSAPVITSVTAGSVGQLTVSWAAVTGATAYDLYYSTTNDASGAVKKTEVSRPYTLTGLANITTYSIWLKAKNSGGESEFSAVASAMTTLPAPTITSLTSGNAGELIAAWGSVSGATGYDLYYRTTNNVSGAAKVSDVTSPHTLTGLSNGTTYYVWVKTKYAGGESGYSTATNKITKPAAPIGITAEAQSPYRILLGWSAVTGAVSYKVYRADSVDGTYTAVVTGITDTSYNDTGLTGETTYHYKVSAVNAGGEGALSTSVSETTLELYQIGDTGPAGGLIFYVNDNGFSSNGVTCHYLEAAPEDLEGNYEWGGADTVCQTDRSSTIGSGAKFTAALTASDHDHPHPAAQACVDYSCGGYDDWFLPGGGELSQMYTNLKQQGLGGFSGLYWSSVEYNNINAFLLNNGNIFVGHKSYAGLVRPVRAF
jgi:hypothetical protein